MRRTPALLLLTLTLVVATAGWLWQTREPAPPPVGPGAADTPAASTEVAHGAPLEQAAPVPTPETTREQLAAPGVFGVVLDFAGAPLPEIQVYLLDADRPEHERRVVRADAEGRFAFADANGELLCGVHNHLRFEQRITLAPGEHRDVVLRATEPCVLLTGRLLRQDEPIAGRHVRVAGNDAIGDVDHTDVSDASGSFCHLLRPGDYRLVAAGPMTEVRYLLRGAEAWSPVDGEPTAEVRLRLGVTPTRVRRDLQVPTGSLYVALQAPGALEEVAVSVALATETRREWTRRGGGLFVELAPGDYLVRASAPLFLEMPTRLVHVGVAQERLDLVLRPAGSLLVTLRHDNELFDAPESTNLLLRHDDETFLGRPDQDAMWRYRGHLFVSLPPGRHLLSCEDTTSEYGLSCQALEPFGPIAVEVVAGETSECSVAVRPRAVLSIQAMRDKEAVDVEITVVGAEGLLAPGVLALGHWIGYAPRGDYEVRISGDAMATRTIRVGDDNVEAVFELPAPTGR